MHKKKKMPNGGDLKAISPEDAAISKVLMERNRDKNFVDRAFNYKNAPIIPTNSIPGNDESGKPYSSYPNSQHSSHLMATDWGEERNGTFPGPYRVYPEIVQKPGQSNLTYLGGDKAYDYADESGEYIQAPTQHSADILSSYGYKKATGIPTYEQGGNMKKETFSGRVPKKTPKKVMNKIMPIKAVDGVEMGSPEEQDNQASMRKLGSPSMNNPLFNSPNAHTNMEFEPMQDDATPDYNRLSADASWNWKPNSAHYGDVNLDTANGVKNLMGITASALPDTKKKNNQKSLLYGYNPQPNGSGTQAIYADGGTVTPQDRDAWEKLQSQAYQQGFQGDNHNQQAGVDFALANGFDPSKISAIQQDFQSIDPSRIASSTGDLSKVDNFYGTKTAQQRYKHYSLQHNNEAPVEFGTDRDALAATQSKLYQPEMTSMPAQQTAVPIQPMAKPLGLNSNGFPTREEAIQKYKAKKQKDNWHTDEEASYDMHTQAKFGAKLTDDSEVNPDDMYDSYDYPEEAAYGIRMMGQGSVQPISFNPYSDAILRHDGPSHADGGIEQAQFGTALETEGGETQYKNTILGNMIFPKVDGTTVDGFTGKKFKNIGKDIADRENRVQKVDTQAQALLKADPRDKIASLTHNSGAVLADGASQNQKALTAQKEMLTRIQQGMLDLSEHTGVKPEQMHKEFRNGGVIKAANGADVLNDQQKMLQEHPDWVKEALQKYGMPKSGKFDDGLDGPRTKFVKNYVAKKQAEAPQSTPQSMDIPYVNRWPQQVDPMNPTAKMMPTGSTPDVAQSIAPSNIPGLPPYKKGAPDGTSTTHIRSLADSNKLGINDFLAESRYLLDHPDQVTSQQYSPQLMSPYQVSYQDRINRNDSTFRAVAQQAPQSVAQLSVAAGANYAANNEVAAEEFRANQGIFNSVMNNNYSLMNEAQKMNLQLSDQQTVRQAQAKSNTDAHKAQALASISNKIDQNKYENMNIRMLEARHKYTYDPKTGKMLLDDGTTAPFDFSGAGTGGSNFEYEQRWNPDTQQYENYTRKAKVQPTVVPTAKWGGCFMSK